MRLIFGREYYTLREAAAHAGISPNRLYRLRRAGVLAAVPIQVGGRWEYYVTGDAVLRALDTPMPTPPAAVRKTPGIATGGGDVAARDAAARQVLRGFGLDV